MHTFKEWCDEKYQIKEICFNKVIHRKIVKMNQSLPDGVTGGMALFKPGYKHYESVRAMSNIPQGRNVCATCIDGTVKLDPKTCPYVDDIETGLAVKVIPNTPLHNFKVKHNLLYRENFDSSDNFMYLMMDIKNLFAHLLNEYHLELKNRQIDEPNTEEVLDAWEKKVASLVTNTQFKNLVDQTVDFLLINEIKNADSTPIYSGYLLLLQAYGEIYRELLTPKEYDDLQKIIGELEDALKKGTLTGDILQKKQSQITSEPILTNFLQGGNGEDISKVLQRYHEDIKQRQQFAFHNQMLRETKKVEDACVDKTHDEIANILKSRSDDLEAIIIKGAFQNYFTICYKDNNNFVQFQQFPITVKGFLLGNTYYTELNALLDAVVNKGRPIQLLKNSDLVQPQPSQTQSEFIKAQHIDTSGGVKPPEDDTSKKPDETLKFKTIENILNGFSEKMKTMPFRSKEAQGIVTELHKNLRAVFINYQTMMLTSDLKEKEQALQNFYTSLKILTTAALDNEVLKNDRPWWTYVVNTFKAIGNAIGYVFSAGSNATFFPYTTSQSVKEVEQLQNEVKPPRQ